MVHTRIPQNVAAESERRIRIEKAEAEADVEADVGAEAESKKKARMNNESILWKRKNVPFLNGTDERKKTRWKSSALNYDAFNF